MQCAATGLPVKTFGVTLLRHRQRHIHKNFQRIVRGKQGTRSLPVCPERRYKRNQHYHPRIDHQANNLRNPPQVFGTISVRETQVLTQTLSNTVAIQHIGALTQYMKRRL